MRNVVPPMTTSSPSLTVFVGATTFRPLAVPLVRRCICSSQRSPRHPNACLHHRMGVDLNIRVDAPYTLVAQPVVAVGVQVEYRDHDTSTAASTAAAICSLPPRRAAARISTTAPAAVSTIATLLRKPRLFSSVGQTERPVDDVDAVRNQHRRKRRNVRARRTGRHGDRRRDQ